MNDCAHVCSSCRTVTIFGADAPYPRRCGKCDDVVRIEPSRTFAFEDETDDLEFVVELRPSTMDVAPF